MTRLRSPLPLRDPRCRLQTSGARFAEKARRSRLIASCLVLEAFLVLSSARQITPTKRLETSLRSVPAAWLFFVKFEQFDRKSRTVAQPDLNLRRQRAFDLPKQRFSASHQERLPPFSTFSSFVFFSVLTFFFLLHTKRFNVLKLERSMRTHDTALCASPIARLD